MDERQDTPLLTLTERSGKEPSRLVVAPHAAVRRTGILLAIIRCRVALAQRVRKTIRVILAAEPDDLLSYVPKRDKVVEGVLLLLERAREDDFDMTTDMVSAAMFLADKGHIDAYGRPVFFDNYVAAAVGPMGVAAREMLAAGFDWSSVGPDGAPWNVEAADDDHRLHANRAPNLRRLSGSDVEALTSALAMVTSLDAKQLRHFPHRQAAYAAAWKTGEGTRLDPRLIPDERNDELIDDLLYASRHAFDAPRRR